jgi:hypothetical protein
MSSGVTYWVAPSWSHGSFLTFVNPAGILTIYKSVAVSDSDTMTTGPSGWMTRKMIDIDKVATISDTPHIQ